MNNPTRTILAAALLALSLNVGAEPIEIEIKGLHIGMSKAEAQAKLPASIGGVHGKREAPALSEFSEGKLDKFYFFFDSAEFDKVLAAVKEKYPALQCESSPIQNRMGASFVQRECSLADGKSVMSVVRYADVTTGALVLESKKSREDAAAKAKQQKKDI